MLLNDQRHKNEQSETGGVLIDSMRLLLAGIALLAYLVEIPGSVDSSDLALAALTLYLVYSLIIIVERAAFAGHFNPRYVIWADVLWYAFLTAVTDPFRNGLFLFFLLAIVAGAFRYGFREGLALTVVSAGLYSAITLALELPSPDFGWTRLVLRVAFLCGIGFLVAYWGGEEIAVKRRLALLRDINQLSNPRFGVDQTIASLTERLRQFFEADACFVLTQDTDSGRFFIRKNERARAAPPLKAEELPSRAARLLLPFGIHQLVQYRPPKWPLSLGKDRSRIYDPDTSKWVTDENGLAASVGGLLDTEGFVSVPIHSGKLTGRVYITSDSRSYDAGDAFFLSQAVDQAFRLIEHVQTLDRMASSAASQERQRLLGNLHDTAIQPYIGLKLGLETLRAQAEPGNPLTASIDRLVNMTSDVIGDLRRYAASMKREGSADNAELGQVLLADIRRQADRYAEYYGIQIDLQLEGKLHISDRLAAEVMQIISEGLSNLRRHTTSDHGLVKIASDERVLSLCIENPCPDPARSEFMPRSIATRARSLGGQVEVFHRCGRRTAVCVTIPI